MTTYGIEAKSPLNENEVTDLAAELLGVSNERELDQFLGALLRRAATAFDRTLRPPILYPLGGMMKMAVRRILPGLGRASNGFVGPAAGNQIGKLAARASQLFGIELEGLSGEDQEFAAAQQLVRLAGSAAAEAALNPSVENPRAEAMQAMVQAARTHAPGLLRSAHSRQGSQHQSKSEPHHAPHGDSHHQSHAHSHHDCGCGGSCGGCGGGSKAGSRASSGEARSGSWVRRGREIILEGV